MQLHQLKPTTKNKDNKRIGRGGKRGTYSGHGQKGQKARAGARIRPGFRGGDSPVWKLFPKQRGATKKVDVKHAKFQVRYKKPAVLNLSLISEKYKDGEVVSKNTLLRKKLIDTNKNGVKILGSGELDKKLTFSGLRFSKTVITKIEKSGSTIVTDTSTK